MSNFERDFLGPMRAEIEAKVTNRLKAAKIGIAREAFQLINARWPVQTGWSIFNNRININSSDVELSPPERPSELGALTAESINENARELDKLDPTTIKSTDTIFIGNAVPYAADVGFEDGRGSEIYAESLRDAAEIVRGDLATGELSKASPKFKGR